MSDVEAGPHERVGAWKELLCFATNGGELRKQIKNIVGSSGPSAVRNPDHAAMERSIPISAILAEPSESLGNALSSSSVSSCSLEREPMARLNFT